MKPRTILSPLTFVACSSLIGCSSGGQPQANSQAPAPAQPPSAQASAAPATPCNAPIRGTDVSTWQLVTLRSFTYCVPPGWRGGGGTWRNGRTSLSAGTGAPPRQRVGVTRRVEVRPGQRPMPPEPPPGSDVRRFDEVISGKAATLYRSQFNNIYYVSAIWETPAVWVTGDTPDAETADLILQIGRTVRFVSR